MAEGERPLKTAKDILGLLREVIAIGVVVVLLVDPAAVASFLVKAGIREIDAGGIQLELQQAADQTQQSTATVQAVVDQLNDLKSQLDRLKQTAVVPEVKQQLDTLSRDVGQTQAKTNQVQTSLERNLSIQRAIIQRYNPADPKSAVQPRP